MRIRQGYIAPHMEHFKKDFLELWGLREYDNPNEPCVFADLQKDETREMMINHNSIAIAMWGGGDTGENVADHVKGYSHIKHPVYGAYRLFLIEMGIDHKSKCVAWKNYDSFQPVPLGDKIYCYLGDDTEFKQTYYGAKYLPKLIEVFGKDRFIFAVRGNTIEWVRDNYYTDSFINIRMNPWAGATTMWEMGCMGRKSIANFTDNAPCALSFKSIDDVIDLIKEEEKKIGTIQYEVSDKTKAFLDYRNDDWLWTEYWK